MSFRKRLGFFLVATLIVVQALTAVVAYGVIRANLVEQAKSQLKLTASVFTRQLNVLSERVSDDVEVLSLDYALRKAVAENDQATALSALRNHGNRVGATRMILVGLDGKITADTTGESAVGTAFPFSDLIETAGTSDQGTSLAVLDGAIYWIVVVPVRAPVPIAFIAACVPVNDALLEKLRQLSSVPQSLALATTDAKGQWAVVSKTAGYLPTVQLASTAAATSQNAVVAAEQKGDHLAMMARLVTSQTSRPVVAVLDYPLEEALNAYRVVITPMLLVLGGALLVALIGAMLIASGVSRPLEALAVAAGRIAKGDYTPMPPIRRRDEIGELSSALTNMTQSIAERETALKGAVASLELARNQAVKASEAKSQFLSNMSHELRTPLNAIIGFSEMIHRQLLGPISVQRYVEYARHVFDSGAHLLVQVEEMLDLSDAESGKLTLARKRLSPGGLLSASLESLAPLAAKSGVKLDIGADMVAWPLIEADAAKLQQSLTNIIHNAIKFTPAQGIVTVSGDCVGDMLKITVTDTGIGIRSEDLALVVRPFHRRKPAFDAAYQGAGLGLPFAKTIIELHGGTLAIQSTQGLGTTVMIELPLAMDAALNDAA
ncbi:MAG TPA: ATP-binding protein [Micropepsaceae bacterium]|nr:ATP-binding protein [Micropepsaceae bacterium]